MAAVDQENIEKSQKVQVLDKSNKYNKPLIADD